MFTNTNSRPRVSMRDIVKSYDGVGNLAAFAPPRMAPQLAPQAFAAAQMAAALAAQQAQGGFPATGYDGASNISPDMWLAWLAAAGCNVPCCPTPEPTTARLVYAGFEPACIKPCGCETVRTSIQAPGQVVGAYVSPSIANCLSICVFNIGRWQALGNCECIPAELFSCCEIDENMFGSIQIPANTEICLELKNKCDETIDTEGQIGLKVIICEPC